MEGAPMLVYLYLCYISIYAIYNAWGGSFGRSVKLQYYPYCAGRTRTHVLKHENLSKLPPDEMTSYIFGTRN